MCLIGNTLTLVTVIAFGFQVLWKVITLKCTDPVLKAEAVAIVKRPGRNSPGKLIGTVRRLLNFFMDR